MNTIKINYCNNNGYMIKNNRNKFEILRHINTILKYNALDSDFKIYSERLTNNLRNKNTVATYISTGKECLVFLTKIDGEPTTFIIEKSSGINNMYPKIVAVSLHFDLNLYNDTLLSAELYKFTADSWYLILDTLLIYNKVKTSYSNSNNIKMLNQIIEDMSYKPIDVCKTIAKTFVKPTEVNTLMDSNIKLKGIKFINKLPIHFYFNKRFMAYPQVSKMRVLPDSIDQTLDIYKRELMSNIKIVDKIISHKIYPEFIFKLKLTSDYGIYNLICNKNGSDYKMGMARVPTIEISVDLINAFVYNNELFVKARYNYRFDKFEILKLISSQPISNYVVIKDSI